MRYLHVAVSGETFYSLSGQFCVGASTVGEIVKETCQAIVFALKDFMKVPSEPKEWKVSKCKL